MSGVGKDLEVEGRVVVVYLYLVGDRISKGLELRIRVEEVGVVVGNSLSVVLVGDRSYFYI